MAVPPKLISAADYLTAIQASNRREVISWPDTIPATHSAPSSGLSRELTQTSPALWSKTELSKRGGVAQIRQLGHKPNEDKNHVFCYLAPRCRPNDGSSRVLLLFALRRQEDPEEGSLIQCARPFDSGGLILDPCFKGAWTEIELQNLIQKLTFRRGWRDHLEDWTAHMFPSFDAYMLGDAPVGREPLGLNKGDRLNFTWELLSEGVLPFANKLVAIMDVRWPGNPSSLSKEARRVVIRKEREGRMRFRSSANASNVDGELYSLFSSASTLPGW